MFPAKTEPEGFEPGPKTVDPFLSEEEVCGDASQAVCMSRQRRGAWYLRLLQEIVLPQRKSGKCGQIFGLIDSWQVVSGLG